MSDLISRQDAIDAIKTAEVSFTVRSDINFADYQKTVQDIFNNVLYAHEQVLKRLPSAQRTGKWLRYGEDGNPNEEDTVFWQCDQCLETYTGRTTRIPNYCPNCGADMRGGDTNGND